MLHGAAEQIFITHLQTGGCTDEMRSRYKSTRDLKARGRSRFTVLAPNPTMKLDFWFSDAGGRPQPVQSYVVNGSQSVSDHYPLQGRRFVIR